MKNIKLIRLLALLTIPFFLITSCEDETGLTSSDMETSQGFIEATLDGESETGEDIDNESIKATKYGKENTWSNKINKNDSIYSITIQRTNSVITWENYIRLKIKYNTNQDVAKLNSIELEYNKDLDDQKVLNLYFDKYWYGNNEIKELDSFEFNEETNELSGKVSINYTYENGNTINADVEFEAQPIEIVN